MSARSPECAEQVNEECEGAGLKAGPRVLISGGLGALGVVVASWMSQHHPNTDICLLGRSGRADVDLQAAVPCTVSALRCDAANQEEISMVLGAYSFDFVIHAGECAISGISCAELSISVDRVILQLSYRLIDFLYNVPGLIMLVDQPCRCKVDWRSNDL